MQYLRREAYYGRMLTMAICLLWPYAYYGYMLPMAICLRWRLTMAMIYTVRCLLDAYCCYTSMAVLTQAGTGRHLRSEAAQRVAARATERRSQALRVGEVAGTV